MRTASLRFQQSFHDVAASPRLAPILTLAAMSLGYGVVQLDVTIVNTALDSIGTSLGGGLSELQWVVSAYTIAFAAFILTAGRSATASVRSEYSWRGLRSSRRLRSPARSRPAPPPSLRHGRFRVS